MKKILIIILSCFVLTGCANQLIRYKGIADIIVGLYRSPIYDEKDLKANEKEIIDKLLEELKIPPQRINIENFINHNSTGINVSNSPGVFVENDICFVDVNYLNFNLNNFDTDSDDYTVVDDVTLICKGFVIFLQRSDVVLNYEDLTQSPKYRYQFVGYVDLEDSYKFVYQSLYDRSGLSITIFDKENITNIVVEYVDIDKIENILELPEAVNVLNIILYITGAILIIVLIIMKKKEKK